MSIQAGWRWCKKCQGLFFAGGTNQGNCIGLSAHDGSASGKYVMQFGEGTSDTHPQGRWRWCHQCNVMHFIGATDFQKFAGGDRKMCFGTLFDGTLASGLHDPSQSGEYVMAFGESGSNTQGGWRWCKKCFGLFFSGNKEQGQCPAKGEHDGSASGHYVMTMEATESIVRTSGPMGPSTVSGEAKVFLFSNGTASFNAQIHESGGIGHNYVITMAFLDVQDETGATLVFAREGTVHGTFDPGSRDDNFQVNGFKQLIADKWEAVKKSRIQSHLHVSTNPIAVVEAVVLGLFEAVGIAAVTLFVADPGTHCFPDGGPDSIGITCVHTFPTQPQ